MSEFKTVFKVVFMGSAFLCFTSMAAAECIQPMVVNANALIAPSVFVGLKDQVMDPSAANIASQAAAAINKKETDAAINQQVAYIRCLAGAGEHKQIIASITNDGAILLSRGVPLTSERNVAVN